jgi:histidinol phosphatase-like PHP family hydrolase
VQTIGHSGSSVSGEDGIGIDLAVDAHVHTGFSAGRATVGELVTAAERAGLSGLTFGDAVEPDVPWLRAYVDSIRRARGRTDVVLRAAIMVDVVRPDGWVALPADLAGLEAVSVALTGLPTREDVARPSRVRDLLRWGALSPSDVVELAVSSLVRAIERTSRYAPTQLARPLSLLAEVGLRDEDVDDASLFELAEACRTTQTVVEVSEAWRCPSRRVARLFAAAGVTMVAASEATEPGHVGQWRYARQVEVELSSAGPSDPAGPAAPAEPAEPGEPTEPAESGGPAQR